MTWRNVPTLWVQPSHTMSGIKISVFRQILALVDRNICNKLVRKHQSDKHSKGINTWTHMVSMIFMQLSS